MNKNLLIDEFARDYNLSRKVVEAIVAYVLGLTLEELFLQTELEESKIGEMKTVLKKVSTGYPLDYLLQKTSFFGLDFYVNNQVLIPRDDTELLVEKASEFISGLKETVYYFDVGTGSGCIPIALFSQVGEKIEKCFLSEISAGALEVAKRNVEKLTPSEKFQFFCEDFHDMPSSFSSLGLDFTKPIVITANLPYVKVHDIYLGKEVLDHEPTIALFGGTETGFELYDEFFEILLLLKSKYSFLCTLFIEIGYDQFEISREFLSKKGLKFSFFRDTGYHDRVVRIDL